MSGESRTKHPSLQGLMYEMYKKNLAIIQARNSSSDKTIFNFFLFFPGIRDWIFARISIIKGVVSSVKRHCERP